MSWKELPDHVRIWIYQSNSKLTTEQIASISSEANQFLGQWQAHGTPLRAAFEVFYNHFLVFFVDEEITKASGCSIDRSVHFIKAIENKYQLSLLDRMSIAYKERGEVQIEKLNSFTEKLREGGIQPETPVFNNLVENKKEFETNWEIPVSLSWMSRFVPV